MKSETNSNRAEPYTNASSFKAVRFLKWKTTSGLKKTVTFVWNSKFLLHLSIRQELNLLQTPIFVGFSSVQTAVLAFVFPRASLRGCKCA